MAKICAAFDSAARAVVFGLAHAAAGAALFPASSGAPSFAAAYSLDSLRGAVSGLSAASTIDLALANVAAGLVVALVALVCRLCPLAVFAFGNEARMRYTLAALLTLLSLFGLAKILAAPAAGDLFWAQAVVCFGCCSIGAFLVDRVVLAVRAWALDAAAARAGLPASSDAGGAEDAEDDPEAAAAAKNASKGRVTLARLLALSRPDVCYIAQGFLCLCVAAVAGTLIPHFTGALIDDVGASNDASFSRNMSLLLLASAVQAVFTGARGWAFTIAIARLKVRIRDRLFRALMKQELGFFDSTSTGELTSRLSSDTAAVGDQVSLNVNVFARSLISMIGALIFMFLLSWRLSLLAFCTVPPTILAAQVYGKFVQKLTKRAQKRLAECNRVAEEALSSMATVRAFAGEQREADRHATILADYYIANKLQADFYGVFAAFTTCAYIDPHICPDLPNPQSPGPCAPQCDPAGTLVPLGARLRSRHIKSHAV